MAGTGNVTAVPPSVPEPPQYIVVTVTAIYLVLFIMGICGNVLVMSVIVRFREMRTCTNCFLFNLSLADLLVVTICMPSALLDLYTKEVWVLGPVMCKLVPFLENAVAHASILTILAISFERYYAICHPLKVQYTCTMQRSCKLLVLIWLLALSSCVPFPIMTKYLDSIFVDGTPIKVCKLYIKERWQKIYLAICNTFLFFIPLILLVVLYSIIIRKFIIDTVFARRNLDCAPNPGIQSRRQVVHMMVAVVLVFFVCLFPMEAFRMWIVFTVKPDIAKLGFEGYLNLLYFVRIMFCLNSVLNPLLYSVFSSKFRCAFIKFIICSKINVLVHQHDSPITTRRNLSLTTLVQRAKQHATSETIALNSQQKPMI